jgi:hypothetical protein
MTNVKAGDVAKIVSVDSPRMQRNLNAVVFVESAVPHEQVPMVFRVAGYTGPWWHCEALSPMIVWLGGDFVHVDAGFKPILCEDKHLKRIDPPEEDESTETERELVIVR